MKKGLVFTIAGNEMAALLFEQAKEAFAFASVLQARSPRKYLTVKTNAEKLDFMAKHVDQQDVYELTEYDLEKLGIGVEDKNA